MATTSIWSIKNNLKQSINYIINPEKTLNKDYGNKESYSYLEEPVKDYNFKEEKVCYVSCLNCDEDNPCDDMEFTKERFRKKDGVLAYHGYQSFKEGEVTPDIAHEIGVKFAEETGAGRRHPFRTGRCRGTLHRREGVPQCHCMWRFQRFSPFLLPPHHRQGAARLFRLLRLGFRL